MIAHVQKRRRVASAETRNVCVFLFSALEGLTGADDRLDPEHTSRRRPRMTKLVPRLRSIHGIICSQDGGRWKESSHSFFLFYLSSLLQLLCAAISSSFLLYQLLEYPWLRNLKQNDLRFIKTFCYDKKFQILHHKVHKIL